MEVICLQEEAFYILVEEVVERLKEEHNIRNDKWVSPERAMELLNIKSKTTSNITAVLILDLKSFSKVLFINYKSNTEERLVYTRSLIRIQNAINRYHDKINIYLVIHPFKKRFRYVIHVLSYFFILK